MSTPEQPNPPAKSQFLVYAAEDGRVKVEVRLENETVWLTQQHLAELFQTTQQNISLHLQNIYEEGELQPAATHKEFLIVRQEGSRQVSRAVEHYNLDAIISVGYRVKSAVATRFRIWATQKLREFTRTRGQNLPRDGQVTRRGGIPEIPPQTDSTSRPGWERFRQGHQTIAATVQAEKGRQEVKSRPAIPGATALCLPSPAGRRAGDKGAQRARDLEQTIAGNLRRTCDLLLPRLLSGQTQDLVCPTE